MRNGKPLVFAMGTSAVSAMAAALCCILPLGTMLLGLGGLAGAGFFAKWRPISLVVSFTLLALAWYLSYRGSRISCSQNTNCGPGKLPIVILSLATVPILAIAAFPILSGLILGRLESKAEASSGATSTAPSTLRVRIPSMDCAACTVLIQNKIRAQAGIVNATVTFLKKEAIVAYEPNQITPAKIITAIIETGFKVEPTSKENIR